MEGIQKTVALGLRWIADEVERGKYGEGDDAFAGEDDCDGQAFLSDMHDEVIDKMQ